MGSSKPIIVRSRGRKAPSIKLGYRKHLIIDNNALVSTVPDLPSTLDAPSNEFPYSFPIILE